MTRIRPKTRSVVRPTQPMSTSKPIGVKSIATSELYPNPHNPRMLFDKQPLDVLRESIRRVGILVPLTVYREKNSGRYVILDGQRRWICAQVLQLKSVPANEVPEPSMVQNIVTMFQIHKLREDWELMPTALKVELLMREVKDRNDARLATLTGLDVSMIVRCKKLISYDKRFQDLMLDPMPEKRVRADFFIELYQVIHDRDVSSFNWFSAPKFTRQMLVKYREPYKTIKAVTDFRLVKQHITNARRIRAMNEFSRRLRHFAETPAATLESLEISEARAHAQARSLTTKLRAIESLMVSLDVERLYGEESLWRAMKDLIEVLKAKLREADKHS